MSKSILITGCSTGIGLCAAQTLQKKGYRVFASARKPSDVEKLRAMGLESIVLDVDDSDSIQQGLQAVLEKTDGKLDALFSNAGYAIPGAVEDLTRDMMRKQFETNVYGPMELVNLVLPPIESRFRDNAHKNYKETISETESAYQANYKKMEEHFTAPSQTEKTVTLAPDAVVKKLLHALESNSPRARYYVGMPAHVFAFLRRILPDAGLDWIIDKALAE
jgi:NAD(P)-dependent dehydrogenase (short-subunit alcohol dehydrogenase family)